MPTLLILSDEFLTRINIGLGEVQAKFAVPVIAEIEIQAARAANDAEAFLAAIEAHVAPIKAKLAQAKADKLAQAKDADKPQVADTMPGVPA